MSDIFQEVDEEVRRDKALEFWTKYQNHLLAIAALIILATAGYRFYDYKRTHAAEAAGASFQDALKLERDGKTAESQEALAKLEADAPSGYRMLGRFVDAAIKAKSDPKAGAAAYDALAADSSIDPLLQDAAKLRAALIRVDLGEIDAGKSALETLATPTGAYRHTARLTLGAIAIGAKDFAGASKWLDLVAADPDTPQAERRDAETLLGVVAANSPPPNAPAAK
jgi:hypothetical protein